MGFSLFTHVGRGHDSRGLADEEHNRRVLRGYLLPKSRVFQSQSHQIDIIRPYAEFPIRGIRRCDLVAA